jgi:hypothetical protein
MAFRPNYKRDRLDRDRVAAPAPMKNREERMKKPPHAKLNAPRPKLHRMTNRIKSDN